MNSLEDIVAHSSFQFAGTYVWAHARTVRNPEKHLLVTRDEKETTVVTTSENLDDLDVVSVHPDRWQLLSIDCANPFECVGFVASIAVPFREAGIDILFTSTFSRDWVFVKEAFAARAAEVLEGAGFRSRGTRNDEHGTMNTER